MTFLLEFANEAEVQKEIETLFRDRLLDEIAARAHPIAQQALVAQYLLAAQSTPYSSRKSKSGYGLSQAILSDLSSLYEVESGVLTVHSDVYYAAFIQAKYEEKSPVGAIGFTDEAENMLESFLGNAIAEALSNE
jgi:hypothetical protein